MLTVPHRLAPSQPRAVKADWPGFSKSRKLDSHPRTGTIKQECGQHVCVSTRALCVTLPRRLTADVLALRCPLSETHLSREPRLLPAPRPRLPTGLSLPRGGAGSSLPAAGLAQAHPRLLPERGPSLPAPLVLSTAVTVVCHPRYLVTASFV